MATMRRSGGRSERAGVHKLVNAKHWLETPHSQAPLWVYIHITTNAGSRRSRPTAGDYQSSKDRSINPLRPAAVPLKVWPRPPHPIGPSAVGSGGASWGREGPLWGEGMGSISMKI